MKKTLFTLTLCSVFSLLSGNLHATDLSFKGDLRLRAEGKKQENTTGRQRVRYRLRAEADAKISDSVQVITGLASGSDDPRSTNQTMTDSFQTPDIRLDLAYLKYQATKCLTILGGKFKRKEMLWAPTDLIFDSDINPEGFAFAHKINISDTFELFTNFGILFLDESSSNPSDPLMFVFQPGVKIMPLENLSVNIGLAFYAFTGIKGYALDHSSGTNSLNSNSKLISKYDAVNPSFEIGYDKISKDFSYVAVLGEYVNNFSIANEKTGYILGLKLGHKKVNDINKWQLKYLYRSLRKDAVLDIFPDSDAYDGETGIKGSEVIIDYGLSEKITAGIDYYFTKNMYGTVENQHLLQLDLVIKF